MELLESTASGPVCDGFAQRLLDRVIAEAPAGELGRGPEPGSAHRHDEPGPLPLWRQGGDRLRRRFAGDPVALEPPADRLVPVAPFGERLRAAQRVALVVDEPDVLQAVERLLTDPRREPLSSQPPIELGRRLLPARDGSKRRVHGASSPQLTSELAEARPLERLPHAQAGSHDHVGRHRPPACSVELDGDPAASKLAKPGDDRHYAGSLTFAVSLGCSGSAAVSVAAASTGAAPDSDSGRSRAETT